MSTHYKNSSVIPMTDKDFALKPEPRIKKNLWKNGDTGYMLMFSSWCPHCQSKVGMWKDLASQAHANYPSKRFLVMASDIEADAPKLAGAAGVNSIPTLMYVNHDGTMQRQDTDWSHRDLLSRIH